MAESKSPVEELRLQLTELDMVQSMFPLESEFSIDDPSVLVDINEFIDGKTTNIPGRLDYVINIQLEKAKYEISCSLPHDYPETEPEVYIRCDVLSRDQKQKLNEDVSNYVTSLERGELCVLSVVQWVQENGDSYVSDQVQNNDQQIENGNKNDKEDQNFSRYWIYSHHIYNKGKRRSILDLGRKLKLTGFCLPGKPGIICAEGLERNCSEFWSHLRHMNWKKILCKKIEVIEPEGQDLVSLSNFPQFEEIAFECRRGAGREFHMDMGEFYRYLEQHNCGYAFKDYFGVDGKKM